MEKIHAVEAIIVAALAGAGIGSFLSGFRRRELEKIHKEALVLLNDFKYEYNRFRTGVDHKLADVYAKVRSFV